MPQLDELLGVVTIAAAGMFVAIAFQPMETVAANVSVAACANPPAASASIDSGAGAATSRLAVAVAAARASSAHAVARKG
jgi:hypothetical protein